MSSHKWVTPRELRYLARNKWTHARRKGLIESAVGKQCVDCGGEANQYDHRNYIKYLEVEPICGKCNSNRPEAYPPINGRKVYVPWMRGK